MELRPENAGDRVAVRDLHRAAFGDHGPVVAVLPMPSYEPWMTGTLVLSHVFWEHDAVGLREPAA